MCGNRAVLAALAIVLTAGCENDRASESPPLAEWSLEQPPALTIGERSAAEAVDFFDVRDIALDEHHIVVAQGEPPYISVFDRDGELLRTFGRDGGGPREQRSVSGLSLHGDTLLVYDGFLGRVQTWALDGTWSDTRRLPPGDEGEARFAGSWDPDRWLIYFPVIGLQPEGSGMRTDSLRLFEATPSTERRREAGPVLFFTERYRYVEGPGSTTYRLPFAARARVLPRPGSIVYAPGQDPEFAIIRGEQMRWISLPGELRRPSREEARDATVDSLTSLASASQDRRIRAAFAEVPVERPLPAVRDLVAFGDRWFGIETSAVREGRGSLWYVHDEDGRAIATLEVPEELEVHAASADHVIGVLRDSLGVERVALFRIRRDE